MTPIKYIKFFLIAVGCLFVATACNNYLDFQYPGSTLANDAFNTSDDAVAAVSSAYGPLQWEYGYSTYFFEWWFGDVCSDDALKGGDQGLNADLDAYNLDNFKVTADNGKLDPFYRTQYIGAFRSNFALENVLKMDSSLFAAGLQNRLMGEAYFLRAMYHFRLLRIFGGVPIADHTIQVQSEWLQPRATEAETYAFIEGDLKKAIAWLPTADKYAAADIGRATKGAARALLMKVYLNMGRFDDAKLQGDSIISIDPYRYQLAADYNQNFDYHYDNNNKESVFDIQYIDQGPGKGDFQTGGVNSFGSTRSNFTTIYTRPIWAPAASNGEGSPSTVAAGWGWNRPTQELYDEFEPGDMRRDAAIINPSYDLLPVPAVDNPESVTTTAIYLGNRYSSRKYAEMLPDTTFVLLNANFHGEINHKEIRYSDVLLMYAEACVKQTTPDLNQAKWALEQVRARARAFSGDGNNVLPPFPNYTIPLQGVGQDGTKQLQDNADDLYLAIQHERRVELAMEGHRWFDLKRWGLLDVVMNHYEATTKPWIGSLMSPFVKGKNEIFPIPTQEILLNPMPQNPGY